MSAALIIHCRQARLSLTQPRIMGILNVTPDSFSDGGLDADVEAAVDRALDMARQGADVIDVGGESTRPGAAPVSDEEQIRRTVPIIAALATMQPPLQDGQYAVSAPLLSIDTQSPVVAAAAIEAGATIINDVNAAQRPGMLELAASSGAALVLMHMRGTPATMQQQPRYGDVVAEVRAFLLQRAEAALRAGVTHQQIILDPGIGFGKTVKHNLALLANLSRLVETGFPVMLGASRKRFLGVLCAGDDGVAPEPRDLVGATCATSAIAVRAGVGLLRVHDVAANRQAALVAHAAKAAQVTAQAAGSPGVTA